MGTSRMRAGVSFGEMVVLNVVVALLIAAILVSLGPPLSRRPSQPSVEMMSLVDDGGETQFVCAGEFVQVDDVDYYIHSILTSGNPDKGRVTLQEYGKESTTSVSVTDFCRFMRGPKGSRIIAFEDPAHRAFMQKFGLLSEKTQSTDQMKVLGAPAQPLQPATTPPP